MKTVKRLSRKEFDEEFGTEEQCIDYLKELKWGNGFECIKCSLNTSYKGKTSKNMRCKNCGYEESATANTVFHKLKFDLSKAFGLIYDVVLSKKGANSIWLGERYAVSQNTAWLFRMKLINYLGSSGTNPLANEVHVDEFEIGTPKKGQQGRSKSDEKTD
jgi:predicted nucleic-acid-binding Zn-ribbon protein